MIRQLTSSSAATLAILGFTVLGGILSARVLMPAGKGELAAVILWPTFLSTIGNMGLVEAVTCFSARQRSSSREFLSTALVIALGASGLLIAVGYFLLPFVLAQYGDRTIGVARLFLLYIPTTLAATLMMATLQGNLKIGVYNLLRSLVQVLTVVGMVLAIQLGKGTVWSFAVVTLVANAVTLTVATTIVLRKQWLVWSFRSAVARSLMRFGLQSQMGSLASGLNLRLDQLLMSAFVGAPALGLYVIAVAVASLASLPATTLNVIALPRMASQADQVSRLYSWGRLLRFSLFLQLVFGAALWVSTPFVVRLFFGSSYDLSSTSARILIVASIPLGLNMMLGTGFRASNHPLTPSMAEAVSLAVTVLGLWLLLPRYGIEGAAWTSLLAYGTASLFLLNRARVQFAVTPRQLLLPRLSDWREVRLLMQRRTSGGA